MNYDNGSASLILLQKFRRALRHNQTRCYLDNDFGFLGDRRVMYYSSFIPCTYNVGIRVHLGFRFCFDFYMELSLITQLIVIDQNFNSIPTTLVSHIDFKRLC